MAILWMGIICVIGYIGSAILCNKVAKEKGLDLTGGFLKKIPMIISGVGVLALMFAIFLDEDEMLFADLGAGLNILIAIAIFLVGAGILFLTNKKADNMGIAITLSIFQAMSGLLMILFMVLKLVGIGWGVQFGGSTGGSSKGSSVNDTIKENAQRYQEEAKKHNEALKEERNEQAEAYARSMGFDSANEAAAYGMGPGREE